MNTVATKEDIMQAMRKMAAKTEDPKMMKHFKGYNKTLLMSFSDIGLDVTMVFQDGHGSATEGTPENPDMTVVTDSMTYWEFSMERSPARLRLWKGGLNQRGQ